MTDIIKTFKNNFSSQPYDEGMIVQKRMRESHREWERGFRMKKKATNSRKNENSRTKSPENLLNSGNRKKLRFRRKDEGGRQDEKRIDRSKRKVTDAAKRVPIEGGSIVRDTLVLRNWI